MEQTQTFGQKAVGLSFNPSGDSKVDTVKNSFANLIDYLDAERRVAPKGSEKGRMFSIAITDLQTAQMWAVKAITWEE